MDNLNKELPTQIEIKDLITQAVSNATARRQQISQELSDSEMESISGGSIWPIIMGLLEV